MKAVILAVLTLLYLESVIGAQVAGPVQRSPTEKPASGQHLRRKADAARYTYKQATRASILQRRKAKRLRRRVLVPRQSMTPVSFTTCETNELASNGGTVYGVLYDVDAAGISTMTTPVGLAVPRRGQPANS